MSLYGKRKRAFFEDGLILECDRSCDLKRYVLARRVYEGYHGRVWFRSEPWLAFLSEVSE